MTHCYQAKIPKFKFREHDGTRLKNLVKKLFEISENFCTPIKSILQSLRNRMVKTVFENSKFLLVKIACTNFRPYILPWGHQFLQAIFSGKSFEFLKIVFIIRFLRLWRMLLIGVQKFCTIPYFLS